jgi:FkbM family methyltransferase
VNFEVDLSEAIDMSLYLFGNFQKHVSECTFFKLPQDAVIFDIGANIGSMSLLLAYKYSQSTVYAFEPTNYAFAKLQRNIELNNNLQHRIKAIQTFILSRDSYSDNLEAFSSWPIDTLDGPRHPIHLGIYKEATGRYTTIDNFIHNNEISRLDLIKIDTDGYELEVLKGGLNSLKRFYPVIVFELSAYILRANNQTFSDFEKILIPLGYELLNGKSGYKVTVYFENRKICALKLHYSNLIIRVKVELVWATACQHLTFIRGFFRKCEEDVYCFWEEEKCQNLDLTTCLKRLA